MTSLLEHVGLYEASRIIQIMVTVYALTCAVRFGKKTFGRVCESVVVMLCALTVMSLVELAHALGSDGPPPIVAGWVVFDLLLSLMVLRFVRERNRLDSRPRIGGRPNAG